MNFSNILHEIANAAPEAFEKTDERRNVLKNISRKVVLTALPFALGAQFKKAHAQSPDTIVLDTLIFLLDIKNLTVAFYTEAVAQVLFPNSETKAAFTTLLNQEQAHARFLKNNVVSMGGTPNAIPAFDLTIEGTLDTFSDFAALLTVAQVLEDTSVRAFKGQTANLMTNDSALTAVLNIHSVDARHASYIRQVRATITGGTATVKPWITGNQTGISGNAFKNAYAGEQASTQAGINIVGISGQNITNTVATEAFDEPLSHNEVLAVMKPFIVA